MERFCIRIGENEQVIGCPEPGIVSVTIYSVVRAFDSRTPDEEVRECLIDLGGMDYENGFHFRWKGTNLKPGDEITIRVLAEGDCDPPASEHKSYRALCAERERDYVRRKALEWGWDITE